MSERRLKRRSIATAVLLTVFLVGLVARLAFLHLFNGERRRILNDQRMTHEKLLPKRGVIYDCHGQEDILALNVPAKDVCADPSLVAKSNALARVASRLAGLLDMDTDEIAVKIDNPKRRGADIKCFVAEDTAEKIRKQRLPGIFLRDSSTRYYPQKTFMCHVLGYVNDSGSGGSGIEMALDKFLRGSPGYVEMQVNALRQKVYAQGGERMPALEGADATLCLDQNVQYIVEKALDQAMIEHHAKGAWAIVERVKTGQILALASRPAFDLNDYRTASSNQMLDRAIGCVYEPGSTLKAVAVSAALNEKVVTADTVFNCENGCWSYGGRPLRDYHPYGCLTVADGLKKSSNILTAKVALRLGDERLYRYLRAYGFGARLGLDLPGEEGGILRPVNQWCGFSITRIAIGQGISVTALQMLGLYCAIANDGFLMRPYVVSRVASQSGVLQAASPEVLGRPISGETAALMRRLLSRVTEEGGTGTRAQVAGYAVAGKTGTAQKPIGGVYSTSANVASFVGFLPAEDPELGIIVVVDEPQPNHTGGVVAAPAFAKIAAETVRYLDIPPTRYMVAGRQGFRAEQP